MGASGAHHARFLDDFSRQLWRTSVNWLTSSPRAQLDRQADRVLGRAAVVRNFNVRSDTNGGGDCKVQAEKSMHRGSFRIV